MSSAEWIAWDVRREDDTKDQLRRTRCGATMDCRVPWRLLDRRPVCALYLERFRPGLLAARKLRKRLCPVGDRHGRGGFVVMPFSATKLSGRGAAAFRMDADHV